MLLLLALHLGRLRHLSFPDGLAVVEAIESIPALLGEVLKTEPLIEEAARLVAPARSALYLGRDLHYPVALEGALKLKEISYIHAEGYPTAEMKHGPIALVDEATPCVFVAPEGSLHSKTLSNVEEVKARNGRIIAVGTEGDQSLAVAVGRLPADPRGTRGRPAAAGGRAAPVAGVSRGASARLRHRQAAQPGQERDGRVSGIGSVARLVPTLSTWKRIS